jgi:hypothetical protein
MPMSGGLSANVQDPSLKLGHLVSRDPWQTESRTREGPHAAGRTGSPGPAKTS